MVIVLETENVGLIQLIGKLGYKEAWLDFGVTGYQTINVIFEDNAGNTTEVIYNCRTLMYKWEKYNSITNTTWKDSAYQTTIDGKSKIQSGGVFWGPIATYSQCMNYPATGKYKLQKVDMESKLFTKIDENILDGRWTSVDNPLVGSDSDVVTEQTFYIQGINVYSDRKF